MVGYTGSLLDERRRRAAPARGGEGLFQRPSDTPRVAARGNPSVESASGVASGTNQLLNALPPAERQRLMRSLSAVFLEVKTVLFEPGGTINSVEFPRNCVVSLVTPLGDGGIRPPHRHGGAPS
jgi:hypothetical protein